MKQRARDEYSVPVSEWMGSLILAVYGLSAKNLIRYKTRLIDISTGLSLSEALSCALL